MDYDDVDFEIQNVQLVGEGSSKFPPALGPYPLSKFDANESLRGSLRFDSLVETEVLLGIGSNGDTQWIEDFSRANSEIGFNVSAAESCSIAIRKNVWSEATSSESVEMLLKSVGQDGTITVTRESDACDELGCIIKQMDPSSQQEHSSLSKVEDVMCLNPELNPDGVPGISSGMKGDIGVEQLLVEDTSKTKAADSVDGGSTSPIVASEKAKIAVTEGSELVVKGDADIHVVQGCSEASTQSDNLVLSKDSVVGDSSTGNLLDTLPPIPSGSDGCRQDPDVINSDPEVHASLDSKVDLVVQITCDQSSREEKSSEISYQSDTKSLIDGIPLPSAQGVPTGAVHKQEVQLSLVPSVKTPADEGEGPLDTAATLNASLSNLDSSSEMRSESHPVSESGEGDPHDAGGKFSHKAVDKSAPVVDISNLESQSDLQVSLPLPPTVTLSCCKEMTISSVSDSMLNESGIDEAKITSEKQEEVNNEEFHGRASSKVKVERGRGSPTFIRISEPKEGTKRPTDQNGLTSGVVNELFKDLKGNVSDKSAGDLSFTFKVPPLAEFSEKETGKDWQPFPSMQQGREHSTVGGSSLTQGITKTAQDEAHGNLKASDKETPPSGSKGSSERKTRRSSSKNTGKEATKRGSPVKKTPPAKCSDRVDRKGNDIPQPFGVLPSSVSSMQDLNTAASSSAMFHQPCTDLQQVQLRAQIFVYGALIQNMAPDEAYMISAFGGPDGGRSLWEKNWRACIERMQGQKSHPINPGTPLQSQIGAKTDQANKQNVLQNKVSSSSASQGASRGAPTTTVNPIIPLSLPLWSVPTSSRDAIQSTGMPRGAVLDCQPAISPLRPHQTPPIRSFENAPWVSKSPFHVPWVPQTTAIDTSSRLPLLPSTEPVNSTPAGESSAPHSLGEKQVSPVPAVQGGSPATSFSGTRLCDPVKAIVAPGQHSAEPKSRGRKKTPVSEIHLEPVSTSVSPSQAVIDPVKAVVAPVQHSAEPKSRRRKKTPVSESHLAPVSTSVSPSTAIASLDTLGIESSTGKFIMPASSSVNAVQVQVEQDAGHKESLSKETRMTLEESQIQAVDAASLASAAISQSQEIWNELNRQKSSGLPVDIETKLTSAAVAITTAAAVAKAAAAAANVASNAALQAKLMADEALVLIGNKSSIQTNPISSGSVKNLGQSAPASILKGEDSTSTSNSFIIAAREASRKRVEAASAASKHAENMVAIVKAAELASEAVSQAGTVVAMGEPFSLGVLVEAGPEAYGRVQKASSQQVTKSKGMDEEQLNSGGHESWGASAVRSKEVLLEKETQSANHGSSATSRKDKKGQKGRRTPDSSKTMVVPESENGPRSSSVTVQAEYEKAMETLTEPNIREGSLVEVLRVGGGSKAAWFLANVLSLRDGKVHVCYELGSENDGDKLKEWVEYKGEGEKAPRLRVARPVTAMPFEGTRKRRRVAMGDYNWAIGDRVDAWMQDSWWEGVVTEKNKKDETSLTVYFPAQGQTSVCKAWHLRRSWILKDGNWVEWSNSGDNKLTTYKGDSPQEKRPRLHGPVKAEGKDKVPKCTGSTDSSRPDDTRLLDLAPSEKTFNIGKADPLRTKRNGLQAEGSRVVYGIPEPGKKRKFMEVSKHYVSDKSKKNRVANESVQFTKYLTPQGSGPRAAKSNPKSQPKEKRMAVSKPNSGKPSSVTRSAAQNNSVSNVSSEADDGDAEDVSKSKDSVNGDEDASGKHNMMNFGSLSGGAARVQISFPSAGSEAAEPRRSNRRIQPTSRLLEGLQSSLIISKIPSASYDKGPRSHQSRNAKRE